VRSLHPSQLECREVVELTTDFLGDALTAVDRAHLEQHLLVCSPCTMHLQQVRATIALTKELATPAPTVVAPSLLAAFRTARKGDP